MKTDTSFSSTFLTGCVLLASFDFAGLFDYALKAGVGGAIWLAYKLTADYLTDLKKKKKQSNEPE